MSSNARKLWSKRVERWKDSGLTAKEFAQEMGINANTLSHWGWKLKGEKPTPPARSRNRRPAARFVEVVATMAPAPAEVQVAAPSQEIAAIPAPEPLEVLLRGAADPRAGPLRRWFAAPGGGRARGPVMLPPQVRILLCTEPQDMRRSFDTLALVTQQLLGEDPQSGSLYVFVSKRATRVKVLWWDKNGYCLLYKRLHRAIIRVPKAEDGHRSLRIDGAALGQLLAGIPVARKRTHAAHAGLT